MNEKDSTVNPEDKAKAEEIIKKAKADEAQAIVDKAKADLAAGKKAEERWEARDIAMIKEEKKSRRKNKRVNATKNIGGAIGTFFKGFSPKRFLDVITPNKSVGLQIMFVVVAIQLILAGWYWSSNTSEILPRPGEIWTSFKELVNSGGLIGEMWTSMKLCIDAIIRTVIISLIICYATVLPAFRPIAFLVSKFRFLSLVGLSFIFTLMTDDGYSLKVWLLTFCMTVFFVTSMMRVINDITKNEFAHARTLGMNEWRVIWHVVILSRVDKVFDIIRQNFAIAWLMITIVEGLSRADGGVGAMLINQNKHLHLDAVFAIQGLILVVGIGLDYLIGAFKRLCCPYAHLTKESKS